MVIRDTWLELEKKAKPGKDVNIIKLGKKKTSVIFWKDKIKDKYFPHRTVLINMELINGMHKTMLVIEREKAFKFKDGLYILDEESKYYNLDAKVWAYDFHENYSLPIKRIIPVADIKKVLESANITEVEYSSNPLTLERFVISKIAEGIMKGQQIDEFMKQIRLLLIITVVSSVLHLMLFAWKTGMLEQIGNQLPF